MSIPKNKPEFVEHCLRRLGQPLIKINVAPQQIDDRVDEAMYRFYEKHYLATEVCWAIFTPNKEDIKNGYVMLPPDIIGVSDVFHASNTSNIYSIDFLMRLSELQSLSKTDFAGISYYCTVKMHMELLNEMFSPQIQYDYNSLSRKLILAGGLKNTVYVEGMFALRVYRKLLDESHFHSRTSEDHDGSHILGGDPEDHSTGRIPVNVFQDRWLQLYTTALIKLQWGQNLGKHQNIQLLGGIMMNGSEIKAEAKAELVELEAQLNSDYSLAPIGFIG